MRLKDQVAVITGAGSGMGRAMAELFVAEGAKVVAADLSPQGVEAMMAGLGKRAEQMRFFQVDVSERSQVEAMIDFALETFGCLDIMVNNAGIMDDMVPVGELPDGLWEKIMRVNLYGVMYACRKAVGIMMEQPGGGRIINTASVGGLNGARAGSAYTASKFGVVGLTRNIGFMYATKGIRCNAICPGGIDTNIGNGLKHPSEFGMARMSSGVGSMPRTGSAEEVARVALFLAAEESSFVNGTTITVDGGWTAF